MRHADEFIFYDDVQFTVRDWRNRNRIKTPLGLKWLTIPTGQNLKRKIFEVEIPDQSWKKKHLETIRQYYKGASCFEEVLPLLDQIYQSPHVNLSAFNQFTVKKIADWIGIRTVFSDSMEYQVSGNRIERLVQLVKRAGGERLLVGPAAKNYLDEVPFQEAGIRIEYFDYEGYVKYSQLYPPFVHEVSVIDLLVHTGKKSIFFIERQ